MSETTGTAPAIAPTRALPLWISIPITIAVSLPFGLWLGKWSLPLWVVFIVWTQYFVLGAKPAALRTIVPSYLSGVLGSTFALVVALLANKALGGSTIVTAGDAAWFLGLFVAFIPVIYTLKFQPYTEGLGSLPFFNGVTMALATYFVGLYASYGGLTIGTDYLVPLVTAIPAVLAGLLGALLGWFNVAIMKPIPASRGAAEQPSGL